MRNFTLSLLLVCLIIASFGIISIYSSTLQRDSQFWRTIYQRQLVWIMLGVLLYLALANFDYRKLWDGNYLIYFLTIFSLVLVEILGAVRLGAQRWLKFGWLNFQPSELAKLSVVIFLASYFGRREDSYISFLPKQLNFWRAIALPFLFVSIPFLLVAIQPDLGTALVLLFILLMMLYLVEVKFKYLVFITGFLLASFPFLWNFLKDYQKDRIMVFLNPNLDPLGAGYTVIQSRIAIGSGGFFGKGWLSGTQSQLRFLPEAHTDFIFATFCEEWGWLGALVLLSLYYFIVRQGFIIGQKTQDRFARFLAYGISVMLAIQILVNLSMNIGFAPVVGIPLPLMSYGGSSVLITFISLGILANIAKRKAVF